RASRIGRSESSVTAQAYEHWALASVGCGNAELLSRHDVRGAEVVERDDRVDDVPGVGARRDAPCDGPERLPRLDHDDLDRAALELAGRRTAVQLRYEQPERDRHRDQEEQHGPTP